MHPHMDIRAFGSVNFPTAQTRLVRGDDCKPHGSTSMLFSVGVQRSDRFSFKGSCGGEWSDERMYLFSFTPHRQNRPSLCTGHPLLLQLPEPKLLVPGTTSVRT